MKQTCLVAGGGGFIGGHVARELYRLGHQVRSVDLKPLRNWHLRTSGVEELQLDLSQPTSCQIATAGMGHVYNFAADMGGMGFIETHKAECMLSVLINTNLLLAARNEGVRRFFFASSACVYKADRQNDLNQAPLAESDAYPAMPEDGYGWEKLFSERMCRHFSEDFGLQTRVARFHNVYGPHGEWDGGREKAPAAVCRKVASVVGHPAPQIQIWGDGEQTRSFTFIDDAVEGTLRLMDSQFGDPLNIGSSEMVSINELVDIVESLAGVQLAREYDLTKPLGVRGRNSDNTLVKSVLGWEPSTSLRQGMQATYDWIREQVAVSPPQPTGMQTS
jgi:GDP-D-mannose 3', 5'-epimerase